MAPLTPHSPASGTIPFLNVALGAAGALRPASRQSVTRPQSSRGADEGGEREYFRLSASSRGAPSHPFGHTGSVLPTKPKRSPAVKAPRGDASVDVEASVGGGVTPQAYTGGLGDQSSGGAVSRESGGLRSQSSGDVGREISGSLEAQSLLSSQALPGAGSFEEFPRNVVSLNIPGAGSSARPGGPKQKVVSTASRPSTTEGLVLGTTSRRPPPAKPAPYPKNKGRTSFSKPSGDEIFFPSASPPSSPQALPARPEVVGGSECLLIQRLTKDGTPPPPRHADAPSFSSLVDVRPYVGRISVSRMASRPSTASTNPSADIFVVGSRSTSRPGTSGQKDSVGGVSRPESRGGDAVSKTGGGGVSVEVLRIMLDEGMEASGGDAPKSDRDDLSPLAALAGSRAATPVRAPPPEEERSLGAEKVTPKASAKEELHERARGSVDSSDMAWHKWSMLTAEDILGDLGGVPLTEGAPMDAHVPSYTAPTAEQVTIRPCVLSPSFTPGWPGGLASSSSLGSSRRGDASSVDRKREPKHQNMHPSSTSRLPCPSFT